MLWIAFLKAELVQERQTHLRSFLHLKSVTSLKINTFYALIICFDWLKVVTRIVVANQNALFQLSIAAPL